ncbi:MAG: ROK family protein [Clostridia bacterium]|nr:ROK family protein [Clostridia bacterium]
MNYLGISYDIKNVPVLDQGFIPFGVWINAYLKEADRPFSVAVERENGKISVFDSFLRGEEFAAANERYVERLVKFLLWSVGGWRVYLTGCDKEAAAVKAAYTAEGKRSFDYGFMQDVYERPFEVVICSREDFPAANETTVAAGGHMDGCRIGFDAGGSDRKVSAVIDGKSVYSEEVVWFPKLSEDPTYQYNEIVTALKTAASKMPRVDAIGVSSAGVFIGNAPMVSSIFYKVPREHREYVKTVYDRAAKEIGENIPIVVANDGDVTALAGAMSLESGSVMGLAMGTSEAVGYVAPDGNLLGWFNELAFAPVDLSEAAMQDEWSGDFGVGCKYFSQDAVIKLAPAVGIELDPALSPAEKLKVVQALANANDEGALKIYASIGVYLAHTLALYSRFYDLKYLLVLGRVASGVGGDLVISECNRVLREEYPQLAGSLTVMLPDEKTRRVGQSVAAASLPELNK